MIKNALPCLLYAFEAYITFAEKFVTIVVTVAFFDYVNHILDSMVNSVAASKMEVA
jgi:hypothetical protein